MSLTYTPGDVPDDIKQLVPFLREELHRLRRALNEAQPYVEFKVLHEEPVRVREGMEVEADGTDWDPGSGAGRYVYRSGAWVFIG